MSTFLENQNWRYATKKFDATKKITDADIAFLKEAIRLSTSSYGLQPYRVFIVENPELRAKLVAASYGQAQVADASHLLVFANELNFGEGGIDQLATTICKTRELPLEAIQGFVPAQVNEILGLDQLGLNATLLAPIGYRHEEDATQHYKKVRKSNEELFITL